MARHPTCFHWVDTSAGSVAASWVEKRQNVEAPARFVADRQYAQVDFGFADMEWDQVWYTALVDVATARVATVLYWYDNDP